MASQSSFNCFGSGRRRNPEKEKKMAVVSPWPSFKRRTTPEAKSFTYSAQFSPTAEKPKYLTRTVSLPSDISKQEKEKKKAIVFPWPSFKSRSTTERKSSIYSAQNSPAAEKPKYLTRTVSLPSDISKQEKEIKKALVIPWPRFKIRTNREIKSSIYSAQISPTAEMPKYLTRTVSFPSEISKQEKEKEEAVVFPWPSFKGRTTHETKSFIYSAQISPTAEKPKSLTRIVSLPSDISKHGTNPINTNSLAVRIKEDVDFKEVERGEREGYGAAVDVSVLIIVMLCLGFWNKLFAIVCTPIWWYAVTLVRNIAKTK